MTTYSAIIRDNVGLARTERPSVHKFNVILLIMVIISAVAFIFFANLRVAWEYSLNLNRNKLNALNAQNVSQDQSSVNPDLETLLLFAQKSGMIEAKDADSILQDGNFAMELTN